MKKTIVTILMCFITFSVSYAQGWFAPFSKQEIKSFHQDVRNGRLSKKSQAALERNVLVNSTDREGNTPLMMAAEKGDYEMVKTLFKHGAKKSVNWRNHKGMSALCLAVQEKSVKTVQLLLANGAKPNLECGFGEDADSPLFLAASYGAVPQIIQALVDKGANVNFTKKNGDTPLIKVAKWGGVNAARILVNAGANINAKVNYVGDGAQTATKFARNHANWAVYWFLLENGGVER